MQKKSKLILFLIILFPSAFWLILETSTINSSKLLYYGPKTLNGTDTVYYSVGDLKFNTIVSQSISQKLFDTINYPLMTVCFMQPKYIKDNYRLEGLLDYTIHKKSEISELPLLFLFPIADSSNTIEYNLRDSLKIDLPNIEQGYWKKSSFDSINIMYFKSKPSHVDYSFIVLLDKKRNIRGYYDGRYAMEIKRMLSEYQHLRLKEEKNIMIKQNEIKDSKPK
ncbi:MAG: hypothetical protein KA163_09485 [Bacteroidia bacterium]|nr:hypothetical protein [Bacteroidia bacterium]